MALTLFFTLFGLVGAAIGLFLSIPLRRWWINRQRHGCVEVLGINTAANTVERHYVRPEANMLHFSTEAGNPISIGVMGSAAYQSGNRPAFIVDTSNSGGQIMIGEDKETRRMSPTMQRKIVKGHLIEKITTLTNGQGPLNTKALVIMMALIGGLCLLGFIGLYVSIQGIADAGGSVGTVVR